MTSPILVTGGTGTLGRLIVRRLRDASRLATRSRSTTCGRLADAVEPGC
jgi:uncharacterized protein YbjT (DUF2867 family)